MSCPFRVLLAGVDRKDYVYHCLTRDASFSVQELPSVDALMAMPTDRLAEFDALLCTLPASADRWEFLTELVAKADTLVPIVVLGDSASEVDDVIRYIEMGVQEYIPGSPALCATCEAATHQGGCARVEQTLLSTLKQVKARYLQLLARAYTAQCIGEPRIGGSEGLAGREWQRAVKSSRTLDRLGSSVDRLRRHTS